MTPDVNVLVAASRTDHPHHDVALEWLQGALASTAHGQALLVLPMVAAGMLRLVTHPRVFVAPTPLDQALAFLRSVLTAPGVEMAELGPEWPLFERWCAEHRLVANDIPDVWIAAAVRSHGERLATFDRGFLRLLKRSEVVLLRPPGDGVGSRGAAL
jgi:toxin-antitoxin system PIN domain toxin